MEQIGIALTGCIAIWLSQQHRQNLKKYACIFGIFGQPFWFYAAWSSEQWGIFVMCFLYTYSWIVGIKNNWFSGSAE